MARQEAAQVVPPERPVASGKVYLVGAGPGDAGLITVRGKQLLESADAIVYDVLVNPALIPDSARATGSPELYFTGRKKGAKKAPSQESVNALLVKLAREGKRVVRLLPGDPMLFSRGAEEAEACNDSQIDFEIVPGLTAGLAAPAYAGIPLTQRGLSSAVTFVTAGAAWNKTGTLTNWKALAQSGATLVLYNALETFASIAKALKEGGLSGDVPAAVIRWGTRSEQKTVIGTLDSLPEKLTELKLKPPALILIGWTVVLTDEISWLEKRPLFGKRIVVTRTAQQADVLSDKLRELGAEVIAMPATRIARLDSTELKKMLTDLSAYEWLIFTSQNGVGIFWENLLASGRDARALSPLKIAAVGPATAAALLERGIAVDVIPERFIAEGLLEKLRERPDVSGARILYVTAENAREVLPDGLRQLGAEVTVVPAYRSTIDGTGAARLAKRIASGGVDLVTFTSGSAVRAYVDAIGPDLARKVPGAAIGPQTSEALRAAGIELKIEAAESTIDGLVSAIVRGA